MHSYGYFMCPATYGNFGRVSDLARREYRLARRPFWPYLRDAEIVLPLFRGKKKLGPLTRAFQRALTPKEERRLTFGCLIQGAKSIAHWGYWAQPKYETGHYYLRHPCLRVGLGALAGNRAGPYVVPDKVVKMLADVWAEVGKRFMFCEPLRGWRNVRVTKRRTKVDWAYALEDLIIEHSCRNVH